MVCSCACTPVSHLAPALRVVEPGDLLDYVSSQRFGLSTPIHGKFFRRAIRGSIISWDLQRGCLKGLQPGKRRSITPLAAGGASEDRQEGLDFLGEGNESEGRGEDVLLTCDSNSAGKGILEVELGEHVFQVTGPVGEGQPDSAAGTVQEKSTRPVTLFTTLVRPLIRLVDGSSLRKEAGAGQLSEKDERKRAILSLLMNPLGRLDDALVRRKVGDAWRQAEADLYVFTGQLGKYVFIMMSTGVILATGYQLSGGNSHEEGVLWFSWLAGIIIGSMIGANQVLENYSKRGTRNVVITGGTRGLGKALAREFLRSGDNVFIASRSFESVRRTVVELQEEIQGSNSRVVGIACDVSKSADVRVLADAALQEFGSVDIWVNNAGMNKGFKPLIDFSDEEIEEIVSTNLVGSIVCTREAIRLMKSQGKAGHIFNMDGAGSGGASTPLIAVYGATKSGLRQLHASLLQECKGHRVGIHTASPGMVLTDLLLSGASLQNKKMFNLICEQPETVARALVPLMRIVKGTGKAVNYLTPPRIILAIVTAWLRRGRWFDEEGRAVYAAEAERLRLWAEGRERSPVTAAMELVPSGTWVSLFSSSVICAYVMLTNSSNGNLPGT